MSRLTAPQRAALAAIVVATALAGVSDYGRWAAIPRFLIATIALAGLAWVVSFATEQLGERFGPAVTGMLQSTLGNLPELFVVIFALQKGELLVAQTAIVGSVLANGLLVLGLVIVVGARRASDDVMRFSKRLPRDTATLLLLTVFIIVLLGLSLGSHDPASHHVKAISAIGAVCLLVVYMTWVIPYLRSDVRPELGAGAERGAEPGAGAEPEPEPAGHEHRPLLPLPATLMLLTAGGAGSAFVSDWFVNGLAPAISQLHLSQAFAGLVIVAIAGNAVENAAGLVLASKGRSDLAISVVKNSVAQIAAFLFPLLVLISFALATTLTFALAPVYIGALALAALALWQVTGDGEAAEFEGWALVALYVILAAFTLYE
ncbi:MAG: sodium:proton exchanger [Solirubrobacteraceae bacterium]